MLQLTNAEKAEVVANCDHLTKLRFSPVLPLAFTEHGAIMAASVLNTPHAIEVSVFVVRAFVRLRKALVDHKEVLHKLTELELKVGAYDTAIRSLVMAIRQMMQPPEIKRGHVGFRAEPPEESRTGLKGKYKGSKTKQEN